jgi:hypothetical protein
VAPAEILVYASPSSKGGMLHRPSIAISNGNSTAIAPEKHCMRQAGRNLGVCHSLVQGWDVASSISIFADGDSTAISPKKHCMRKACRNHCCNQGQLDLRRFDMWWSTCSSAYNMWEYVLKI